MSKTISSLKDDYSAWYNDVIAKADLAENSPVRGCMIIKPYGYALWENMRIILDNAFKATGHVNAYFPLFVPKSFFTKEATHIKGFAKECAIVTHYRLKKDSKTNSIIVDPDAKLEEELIVRPTSETIIWNTYRNWIKSYRDLPLLINQWANVVRWEMRTRPFLRTSEFLWQEGHTAHASQEEAIEEAIRMNDIYAKFIEEEMALPVIKGIKSASERFAGAVDTYCVEALMRDGKALQAGTSHFLGQNFAKAFDVQYLNDKNEQKYVWATSWGVSTRLIGALIMGHGDEKGLVLPPRIAPIQVILIPIYKGEENKQELNAYGNQIAILLSSEGIRVQMDKDPDARPGWKHAQYELKGVPIRLVFGKRDMDTQSIEMIRRDNSQKEIIPVERLASFVSSALVDIQQSLYQKALEYKEAYTTHVKNWTEFEKILKTKGGFISAYWDGSEETETQIKTKTKATIRCIPLEDEVNESIIAHEVCVFSGKQAKHKVLFAIAY